MASMQQELQIVRTRRGYESGLSLTAAKARHLDSAFRRAGFLPKDLAKVPKEDWAWIISSLIPEHRKLVREGRAILFPRIHTRYAVKETQGFFDVIDWDLHRLTRIAHDPTIVITESRPNTLSQQVVDIVGYELEVNAVMYYVQCGKESPKFRQAIKELAYTRGGELHEVYTAVLGKAEQIRARINTPQIAPGTPDWWREDVYAIQAQKAEGTRSPEGFLSL